MELRPGSWRTSETEKQVWTLEEIAGRLNDCTINAQLSVISMQADLLACTNQNLDYVQTAVCNAVTESVKLEIKSVSHMQLRLPESDGENINSVVDKVFDQVGMSQFGLL